MYDELHIAQFRRGFTVIGRRSMLICLTWIDMIIKRIIYGPFTSQDKKQRGAKKTAVSVGRFQQLLNIFLK